MLDMGTTDSTSQAARFSEIIRLVDGRTVTVSYRGEPVAEVRPVRERRDRQRLVIWNGAASSDRESRGGLKEGVHVPGALKRFLEERG